KLEPNTTYTISYDYTLLYKPTTRYVSSILGRAYLYSPTDASKRVIMADVDQSKYSTMKVGDKTHISSTFTTPHDLGDSYVIFYNTYHQDENGVRDYAKVLFEKVMLVKGNKSTDWTPAPEDIESKITKNEASIQINSDEIIKRVTKTEFNTKTGQIEQTANTAKSTADSNKQTIATVKGNVDALSQWKAAKGTAIDQTINSVTN
ncbi:hypothetical protein, partial [Staphylococcus capitis]|uniref:hypothetical protein n=1 Tax=Staphylococcus capitis TaxID=29388 RepID=UPI00066B02E3